jgi:hypothetical protein
VGLRRGGRRPRRSARARTTGRGITVLLGCVVLATACSASVPAEKRLAVAGSPLPASEPYLVMTAPGSGWAVWPSGRAWVLLHTSDGFRHVDNRTPIGVPTDGGLVGSFLGDRAAVAVSPVERLLRSPLLTTAGSSPWAPTELPAGIVGSRTAVALTGTGTSALTAGSGGTLTIQAGTDWRTAVDARALPGSPDLLLDGVTWADDSVGWLTGHGPAGGVFAFQTTDSGASWMPVRTPGTRAVAALSPCGAAATWALPVLDSTDHIQVLRTTDRGGTWTSGGRLPTSAGEPAWGCQGRDVWMVAGSAHGDAVFASTDDGGTWTNEGPAPAHLTYLSPTGGGDGFAASGGRSPTLWRVTGDGAQFSRIDLPGWVAGLGATTGED